MKVSRIATVFLFIASIGVTSQLSSVEQAWRFLLAIGAGTGLVLILRWYWWRINAWSEISAMIASFVVSIDRLPHRAAAIRAGRPQRRRNDHAGDGGGEHGRLAHGDIHDEPGARRGPRGVLSPRSAGRTGLAAHRRKAGFGREGIPGGALAWTNWIAGIVAVYSTLFGIGKLIFGET